MFKKIDYTMIMVTDMKRSLHFYRDILIDPRTTP